MEELDLDVAVIQQTVAVAPQTAEEHDR